MKFLLRRLQRMSCESFRQSTKEEGAQTLANLSYKFVGCLDRYSLLDAADRSTVLSYNAAIICSMAGYATYCEQTTTATLRQLGPTCIETGLSEAIKSLMKITNLYKCVTNPVG